MPRITDLIRRHLLEGVRERLPSLSVLVRTERSGEFEKLRTNRKIMGAFRYGRMGDPDKPQYDRVADMIDRLQLFMWDLNGEHLVDVANLAELEFVEGRWVVTAMDGGRHSNVR